MTCNGIDTKDYLKFRFTQTLRSEILVSFEKSGSIRRSELRTEKFVRSIWFCDKRGMYTPKDGNKNCSGSKQDIRSENGNKKFTKNREEFPCGGGTSKREFGGTGCDEIV